MFRDDPVAGSCLWLVGTLSCVTCPLMNRYGSQIKFGIMTAFSVRVSGETASKITQFAEKLDRSRSYMVAQASRITSLAKSGRLPRSRPGRLRPIGMNSPTATRWRRLLEIHQLCSSILSERRACWTARALRRLDEIGALFRSIIQTSRRLTKSADVIVTGVGPPLLG